MKYIIEFINNEGDHPSKNFYLTFGETDIKSIAEKCFEYGSKRWFSGIRIKKEYNDKEKKERNK